MTKPNEKHPGSEREADAKRPGGPRYHGGDWKRADAEEVSAGAEKGSRADDPVRVDPGQVPGATAAKPSRPKERGV
jgi:hypothetical protein